MFLSRFSRCCNPSSFLLRSGVLEASELMHMSTRRKHGSRRKTNENQMQNGYRRRSSGLEICVDGKINVDIKLQVSPVTERAPVSGNLQQRKPLKRARGRERNLIFGEWRPKRAEQRFSISLPGAGLASARLLAGIGLGLGSINLDHKQPANSTARSKQHTGGRLSDYSSKDTGTGTA